VEILLISAIIIAVAVVIFLFYYLLQQNVFQKRQTDLFLMSQENGWEFSIEDPACMLIKYGYFECIQADFDIRAGNVISGVTDK